MERALSSRAWRSERVDSEMGGGGFGSEGLVMEWTSRSLSIPDTTSSMACKLGTSLPSCKSYPTQSVEIGGFPPKSSVLEIYFLSNICMPCEMQKAELCSRNNSNLLFNKRDSKF